jgi:mono/diheme cytochrome c family protein
MLRPVSRAAAAGLLAALGVLLAVSPVAAQDAARGELLARQWCSGCHAVAPGESGNELAPSFEAVVRERQRTQEWLETWLSVPHETMPDLGLSRSEIADLVAYLQTLGETQ